jgi:hypothetical protein
MNITFLGSGQVGSALAEGLARAGHNVTLAARDMKSDSIVAALEKHPSLEALPIADAVRGAEIVFLATPYAANEAAIRSAGELAGKVLVDCTNPVGAGLTHALDSKRSGSEVVQALARGAHVVKAFTIYGFENFDDSSYPGYGDLKPAMLIAGNDPDAKARVSALCEDLGFEPVDAGDLGASLHLEHMTLLWIKMARVQARGAGMVWGLMTR